MNRHTTAAAFALAAIALVAGACALPARADSVIYSFAALRGGAPTCQWFDDNINDRSMDSIVTQTDMLYNRTALPAGEPVSNVQTAPLKTGRLVAGFTVDRTGLCSGDDAINPNAPQPSTPPSPEPT